MYALQIATFGDPSDVVQLVNIPDPEAPAADEVLIGVEYAPINNSNLLVARGWYGVLPSLPAIPGNEGVGRVLAVGENVAHLKVGDRVLVPFPRPSWLEKTVVPSAGLFPLPQNADPQQLAMLSVNPTTAALLLSDYVNLSTGDWVIQNASNSGVGRGVIAFARDRGLRTVSLVRRQELIDDLVAAGSDVVLLDGEGVVARVAEATGNAKITLGFDGVGGEATLSISGSLAPGGTVVTYSGASGQPGLINAVDTVFRNISYRGLWIQWPEIFNSSRFHDAIKTAARLVAEEKLHVPVAATYPLTEAKEAFAHAQKGGKVLFKIS